jgi:CBS domain-containing protein
LKSLPVVSRNDASHVEGVVTLEDILRVYGLEDKPRIERI